MQAREAPRRRIVVGFDGSDAALRALGRAAEAVAPEGTIVVVTVEAALRSPGALSEDLLSPEVDPAAVVEEARTFLGTRGDITVEAVLGKGDPASVIVDAARESGADLIVVGRRGRDFAARALLGSVAAHVVEWARCDVLVVA